MNYRLVAIPLLVALCVLGPVFWAWPEELGPLRSLGIVLGWCACGLLLASLLLMLREPSLARPLGGLARMYRWHHVCGTLAYLCLLAHPLALAVDAGGESPALAWQTLSPVGAGWPQWTGWLGLLGIMAGLAATFTPWLRYRTWRWLHGAMGVAVLLGLAHLVLLGLSAIVLVIGALVLAALGGRLVRADFGFAARPYVVEAVAPVARDMVEITLGPLASAAAGPQTPGQPGQFVMVAFGRGEGYSGCGEFHPYTLSRVGSGGQFSLGIKALGPCSRRIQTLVSGVPARVQGPFGDFLEGEPTGPQYWVAGGIGITPFLAVLRAGRCFSHPIRLLYLYRHPEDGAFLVELQGLAADREGFDLEALATGESLPDLAVVIPQGAALKGRECWLCGPPALLTAAGEVLRGRGVTARHIHDERFDFR